MARRFATAIDLQQNELIRGRIQNATGDPAGVIGQLYYNTTVGEIRVCIAAGSPGTWVAVHAGPITSSDIQDGTITDADVAAANKDGSAATPSLRTLGTGATQAAAGNDTRLTDSRAPSGVAGGDLAGTYPNPTVGLLKIDDTKVAAANKDGAAGVPSMRTIGAGAAQVVAGNDARLTNARTPTAHASTHQPGGGDAMAVDAAAATGSLRTLGTGATQAAAGNDGRFGAASPPNGPAGGDLTGTYPNPTVAALAVTDAKVATANKDGAVGVPSMRTLGNGALQAAAGNDTRLSDARTPTAHAASHQPGGGDAMAVDAAVATGSLRTLGAGAQQAMPGNRTLDAITAPVGAVAFNNQRQTGVADPVAAQDGATKAYVDAVAAGLDIHGSVRVASTANVALPPGGTTLTIDGIALANGDRVLLKDQTTGSQNGVYVVSGIGSAVVLTRSTDADTSAEVTPGFYTFVEQGTANADQGYVLVTDAPIVLGTTALVFTQSSGAGQVTAGAGLSKTGNTLAVVVDASSIEINANTLRVKAAGITNAMLAGAIDLASKVTGLLGIANGGTGAATAAAARTNLVAAGRYDNAATHAAGTSILIAAATHGLGAGRNKVVQVVEEATGDAVETDLNIAANGDVTVGFAVAVALNTYRVLVVGW